MINIPTDLLRTLVAVVDQRSFTKAAATLGITQPAVSAQIKRLQLLLTGDLFDRSVPGVSLTPQGELIVTYARRLLAVNDQIVHIGGASSRPDLTIRVATPSDFIASMLPDILARFREQRQDTRFVVLSDNYDVLLRDLRNGDVDIFIGLAETPQRDACYRQMRPTVWVHREDLDVSLTRPVPLVTFGEDSIYHRIAVAALNEAQIDWEDVFTGPGVISVSRAVAAGFGVMPITRFRAEAAGLCIWDDGPLPKLPDLYHEIFIRDGGQRAAYEELAANIALTIYGADAYEALRLDTGAGAKTGTAA